MICGGWKGQSFAPTDCCQDNNQGLFVSRGGHIGATVLSEDLARLLTICDESLDKPLCYFKHTSKWNDGINLEFLWIERQRLSTEFFRR